MPQYFIVAAVNEADGIPAGAKVDMLRMNSDYLAQTHEMLPSCGCRSCRKLFAEDPEPVTVVPPDPRLVWCSKHVEELRPLGPCWIAVGPEGLVAHAKEMRSLREQIQQKNVEERLLLMMHTHDFGIR